MSPASAPAHTGHCRAVPAALLALAVLLAGAGAATAGADWQRLRHLAVPTLHDPSLAPAAALLPIESAPGASLVELARLPGRVSALLQTDGTVWAGGFDTGVFRLEERAKGLAPVAVLGVAGRERFVNALAARQGRVFAATYAGILELEAGGRLARRHLPRLASESLLATEDGLLAGTAGGLFALRGAEFEPVALALPAGAPRITALALSGRRLWLGTPSGVYSIAWPQPEDRSEEAARWHPLVFGERAARSNVVLALLPWGEGVLAGTDDGGVVEVGLERARAFETEEPRANEINPGAAALAGGRALFGTQGGGLLELEARGDGLAASRPQTWLVSRVSAVHAGERLLVGGEDGRILLVTGATGE